MELKLEGNNTSLTFTKATHDLDIRFEGSGDNTIFTFEISSNDITKIMDYKNKILTLDDLNVGLNKIMINGTVLNTYIDKNFYIESSIQSSNTLSATNGKITLLTKIYSSEFIDENNSSNDEAINESDTIETGDNHDNQ